jgi:ribosomal protein L1
MPTQGKKFRAATAKVDRTREYPIPEAVSLVKSLKRESASEENKG